MNGYAEIDLGTLDTIRLRVLKSPGASLLSIIADVFGGRFQGVPGSARQLVRAAAPPNCAAVLNPLFATAHAMVPDCLVPSMATSEETANGYLERLSDLSPDTLLAELETEFPGVLPLAWQPVVSRPRAWLRLYGNLMQSAWAAIHPAWRSSDSLFMRECENLGAATVNGTLGVALLRLGARFELTGNRLQLRDRYPGRYRLNHRRELTLVPLASGAQASVFSYHGELADWIGYPLPGLATLWERSDVPLQTRRSDPLALVLGEPRAAVLRAVDRPLTMGELSMLLRCSPGTTTHHCTRLEAAGLLNRVRRGQHVQIARTGRGDELIDLLV